MTAVSNLCYLLIVSAAFAILGINVLVLLVALIRLSRDDD